MLNVRDSPIDLPLQRQKAALAGADAERNVGHPMELWPKLSRTIARTLKLITIRPFQSEHIGDLSDLAKAKSEGNT